MSKLPEIEPLWITSASGKKYSPLRGDLEVDAAVVGAGIAGLTTAYLLKRAGLKVAVVEKDRVGSGVTGHTTGKLTSQHNILYHDLDKAFGRAVARAYGEANQTAVAEIERIIKRERIACDWQRDDNYVFTEDTTKVRKFRKEAAAARRLGLPATFETETPLPFPVRAAVRFKNQAKFHARKYLYGLAKAINGNGSYVFEQTQAKRIRDGSPARVVAQNGVIRAQDVVLATHVPFPFITHGVYCALEYPKTSYVVAGRISTKLEGMYITSAENTRSILPVTMNRERWLLVAGESHLPTVIGDQRESRYQKVAKFAEDRLGLNCVEKRWMAFDYLGYDGLPLVGKLYPWNKHLHVMTAFRKWGLTNGTVSAMILVDNILGRRNPWAEVFNSARFMPASIFKKLTT